VSVTGRGPHTSLPGEDTTMTIRRWWAAGLALTCAAGLARA
jgi:hypothetical protein